MIGQDIKLPSINPNVKKQTLSLPGQNNSLGNFSPLKYKDLVNEIDHRGQHLGGLTVGWNNEYSYPESISWDAAGFEKTAKEVGNMWVKAWNRFIEPEPWKQLGYEVLDTIVTDMFSEKSSILSSPEIAKKYSAKRSKFEQDYIAKRTNKKAGTVTSNVNNTDATGETEETTELEQASGELSKEAKRDLKALDKEIEKLEKNYIKITKKVNNIDEAEKNEIESLELIVEQAKLKLELEEKKQVRQLSEEFWRQGIDPFGSADDIEDAPIDQQKSHPENVTLKKLKVNWLIEPDFLKSFKKAEKAFKVESEFLINQEDIQNNFVLEAGEIIIKDGVPLKIDVPNPGEMPKNIYTNIKYKNYVSEGPTYRRSPYETIDRLIRLDPDFLKHRFDAYFIWGDPFNEGEDFFDKLKSDPEFNYLTAYEKDVLSKHAFAVRFGTISIPLYKNKDFTLKFEQTEIKKISSTKDYKRKAKFSMRLDNSLVFVDQIQALAGRNLTVDYNFMNNSLDEYFTNGIETTSPWKKAFVEMSKENTRDWKDAIKVIARSFPPNSNIREHRLCLVIKHRPLHYIDSNRFRYFTYFVFENVKILGTSDNIKFERESNEVQNMNIDFTFKKMYTIEATNFGPNGIRP